MQPNTVPIPFQPVYCYLLAPRTHLRHPDRIHSCLGELLQDNTKMLIHEKKSPELDMIGEGRVTLTPVHPEDMVRAQPPRLQSTWMGGMGDDGSPEIYIYIYISTKTTDTRGNWCCRGTPTT